MTFDPEESEDEQVIRKLFETHETGAFEHPVLGHVDPWGFGWACQFTDTTTLRIPVHVTFCAGNPVSQHDEDNYLQIRARFPSLLRAWHADYRKLRAADEIYGGPAEVLDLEIHSIHEIIGPKTVWRIAATARPYDGNWEFKMRGWKFTETVGGIG